MSAADLLLIGLAGVWAGFINTVVGSGTLITFPVLLAMGVPPVVANVSNTIGLAPGSFAGAWAMRPELEGQRSRILRLGPLALVGGIIGAVLLLRLPPSAFAAIVPVLIGMGCLLVILQPVLSRRVATRRERLGAPVGGPPGGPAWLGAGVLGTGIYGGYFGAAQGVLLLGLLGIGLDEPLPRINALKNVLAMLVNGVAGIVFILVSHVDWPVAVVIAVGAVLGSQLGARVGRRLPPTVYRVVIVAVGVVAIINLLR
ncbi:MAG: sulfite exporter TauE/SafE family protein [Janthinobacterium lividum]